MGQFLSGRDADGPACVALEQGAPLAGPAQAEYDAAPRPSEVEVAEILICITVNLNPFQSATIFSCGNTI